MIDSIEKAIVLLADKIDSTVSADDALKYTQAACNLANTRGRIIADDKGE